jgi:hypothetical protein
MSDPDQISVEEQLISSPKDRKYFAYAFQSPFEVVWVGLLPSPQLAQSLASAWKHPSVALSEEDCRAIANGDLVPVNCPNWARPYLARDLAVLLGEKEVAKRWQSVIDFVWGDNPKPRGKIFKKLAVDNDKCSRKNRS